MTGHFETYRKFGLILQSHSLNWLDLGESHGYNVYGNCNIYAVQHSTI
jgi:hypothetical protein